MNAALAQVKRQAWLLLIAAAGIATAFYCLDARGLWGDEVWNTLWSQQQPPWRTLLRFNAPPDFPLQFLLTQITTWPIENEWTARLPSALLGAATVVLLYAFGRKQFNLATGVCAALLLAAAPYHVWYSQEARPYAAQACFSLLTLVFVCLWLRAPSWRVGVGLTISTTLNLYNQFFALMPLLAEGLGVSLIYGWWWLQARGAERARRVRQYAGYLASMAAAAILTIPLIPGYVSYILAQGPGEVEAPPFTVTPEFLQYMFGILGAGSGWMLALFGLLFMIGLVAALARRNWIVPLVLLWLILPFAILWLTQPRHVFIPRYFLFLQPVYLLMVGHGLMVMIQVLLALWRRIAPHAATENHAVPALLYAGTVGAVLAVTFWPSWISYHIEKRNDWTSACAYLKQHAQPGDAVTGDAYIIGLMMWCLRPRAGVALVDSRTNPPEQLAARGMNVWYVHIDPQAKFDWVAQTATAIPKTAWARPGLVEAAQVKLFPFPQGEHPTTLYYYATSQAPAQVQFHEVRGSGDWPDYAQVPPYDRYAVRLALKADKPRLLRLTYFDLKGRDLKVLVNGANLAEIDAGKSGGKWVPIEIPLPSDLPDMFLVEFVNPGKDTSAVSEVQVMYAAETK